MDSGKNMRENRSVNNWKSKVQIVKNSPGADSSVSGVRACTEMMKDALAEWSVFLTEKNKSSKRYERFLNIYEQLQKRLNELEEQTVRTASGRTDDPGAEKARLQKRLEETECRVQALKEENRSLLVENDDLLLNVISELRRKNAEIEASKPYKEVFDRCAEPLQLFMGISDNIGTMDPDWAAYYLESGIIDTLKESRAVLKKADQLERKAESAAQAVHPVDKRYLREEKGDLERKVSKGQRYLQQRAIAREIPVLLEAVESIDLKNPDKQLLAGLSEHLKTVFRENQLYPLYQKELWEYPQLQMGFYEDSEAGFEYPGLFIKRDNGGYEVLAGFQGRVKKHCQFGINPDNTH